jgi:hypothetical protein
LTGYGHCDGGPASEVGIDDIKGVSAKTTTTATLDFGRISFQKQLVLYLSGTPARSAMIAEISPSAHSSSKPQVGLSNVFSCADVMAVPPAMHDI